MIPYILKISLFPLIFFACRAIIKVPHNFIIYCTRYNRHRCILLSLCDKIVRQYNEGYSHAGTPSLECPYFLPARKKFWR